MIVNLQKRPQAERIIIAETLLSTVWDEIVSGTVDDNILQEAVNCQVYVNRIVWKLNERRSK